MRRLFCMGLGLFLAWAVAAQAAPGQESLAIDREHVRVWTVDYPGEPLRGFRAVTTVRSSLSALVSLLTDTSVATDWLYRTKRMQLLHSDPRAGTFTVVAEMDFWPLPNRDAVVEGRLHQDPVTHVVTIESRAVRSDAVPPRPGVLRMNDMRGRWEFRPLGDGLVQVSMNGHGDPGGQIPDFLVNLMVQQTPYHTLQGLRRAVASPRYRRAQVPGIRELQGRPAAPVAQQ